jgi:hypothetical protein
MIIHKPHHCTKLDIWTPRYSDKFSQGESVALIAQYKVQQASPVIIINFSKSKHLASQRFCITRDKAMRQPLDTNGKIPCYAIPMSQFERWESAQEVHDVAMGLFE